MLLTIIMYHFILPSVIVLTVMLQNNILVTAILLSGILVSVILPSVVVPRLHGRLSLFIHSKRIKLESTCLT
jgi:hypothetical protein